MSDRITFIVSADASLAINEFDKTVKAGEALGDRLETINRHWNDRALHGYASQLELVERNLTRIDRKIRNMTFSPRDNQRFGVATTNLESLRSQGIQTDEFDEKVQAMLAGAAVQRDYATLVRPLANSIEGNIQQKKILADILRKTESLEGEILHLDEGDVRKADSLQRQSITLHRLIGKFTNTIPDSLPDSDRLNLIARNVSDRWRDINRFLNDLHYNPIDSASNLRVVPSLLNTKNLFNKGRGPTEFDGVKQRLNQLIDESSIKLRQRDRILLRDFPNLASDDPSIQNKNLETFKEQLKQKIALYSRIFNDVENHIKSLVESINKREFQIKLRQSPVQSFIFSNRSTDNLLSDPKFANYAKLTPMYKALDRFTQVKDLEKLQKHFETQRDLGKDVNKQLAITNLKLQEQRNYYEEIYRERLKMSGLSDEDIEKHVKHMWSGQGSQVRSNRFQALNMAYAVEDAVVGYDFGGISMALRSASNNISAIFSTLNNVKIATIGILGSAAAAFAIPRIISWVEEIEKGTIGIGKLEEGIEKLNASLDNTFRYREVKVKLSEDMQGAEESPLRSELAKREAVQREAEFLHSRLAIAQDMKKDDPKVGVFAATISSMSKWLGFNGTWADQRAQHLSAVHEADTISQKINKLYETIDNSRSRKEIERSIDIINKGNESILDLKSQWDRNNRPKDDESPDDYRLRMIRSRDAANALLSSFSINNEGLHENRLGFKITQEQFRNLEREIEVGFLAKMRELPDIAERFAERLKNIEDTKQDFYAGVGSQVDKDFALVASAANRLEKLRELGAADNKAFATNRVLLELERLKAQAELEKREVPTSRTIQVDSKEDFELRRTALLSPVTTTNQLLDRIKTIQDGIKNALNGIKTDLEKLATGNL